MTIEETQGIIKWVIGILVTIGVPTTSGLVYYVNSLAKRQNETEKVYGILDERLKANDILTAHLVRAGEVIKEDIAKHKIMLMELCIDIKYMKETQAEILSILKTHHDK